MIHRQFIGNGKILRSSSLRDACELGKTPSVRAARVPSSTMKAAADAVKPVPGRRTSLRMLDDVFRNGGRPRLPSPAPGPEADEKRVPGPAPMPSGVLPDVDAYAGRARGRSASSTTSSSKVTQVTLPSCCRRPSPIAPSMPTSAMSRSQRPAATRPAVTSTSVA